MSTLTSLISAGGGGGGSQTHIVTDPRQLNRLAVPADFVSIMTNSANTTSSARYTSQDDFWDGPGLYNLGLGNSVFTPRVAVTAANTYATLLDTSNANGGYLYWILGLRRAITAGSTSTIKITVDGGEPFEITYTNSTGLADARPFLGSGVSGSTNNGLTSGTMTNSNDFWNSTSNAMGYKSTFGYEDFTNGFFSANDRQQRLIADFGVLDNANFQKLYFTTSLKIEVKQSVYSTTTNWHKAACLYKLL